MGINERLKELGIILPRASPPDFNYVPVKRAGNLLFVSGQLPRKGESFPYLGKVGQGVSEEEARECSKLCIIQALSQLKLFLGDLNKIDEVVKVTGFVSSSPNFTNQPYVINAASDLLVDIFGEKGRHTRSAIGMAVLPFNCPVEIELVVTDRNG
jgi:enamine deaminase RidA (YjgF/YER057c/UK114 family)